MITSDDILSLNFYNYGNPFTGSYQGMRYRIIKQKEAKDEVRKQIMPAWALHLWRRLWMSWK